MAVEVAEAEGLLALSGWSGCTDQGLVELGQAGAGRALYIEVPLALQAVLLPDTAQFLELALRTNEQAFGTVLLPGRGEPYAVRRGRQPSSALERGVLKAWWPLVALVDSCRCQRSLLSTQTRPSLLAARRSCPTKNARARLIRVASGDLGSLLLKAHTACACLQGSALAPRKSGSANILRDMHSAVVLHIFARAW